MKTSDTLLFFQNHLGYRRGETPVVVLYAPDPAGLPEVLHLGFAGAEDVRSFSREDFRTVDRWAAGAYLRLELPAEAPVGEHRLEVRDQSTASVLADAQLTVRDDSPRGELADAIAGYFSAQRCSGDVDEFDRAAPFFGDMRQGTRDVHGGWCDASGDVSKYLSHLSYANYLAPQQTPLVVWTLFQCAGDAGVDGGTADRARREAFYGADFLMRMLDEDGYFYQIIFDRWSKDLALRNICNYSTQRGYKNERIEASFRQGGGMAIAALARAAREAGRSDPGGEFSGADYAEAARRAFAHLREHNISYCDDSRENVIDDYCALMASAELYSLTGDSGYVELGLDRAERLIGRQDPEGFFWADDERTRPFFHASDEGLPVISLLIAAGAFAGAAEEAFFRRVLTAVRRGLEHWLRITHQSVNPFGYPRQRIASPGDAIRDRFFFPHVNESGYWWQGENARLGSICAASRMARREVDFDDETRRQLISFEADLENWLLGLNPFDACMVEGFGRNNPVYDPGYPGLPGGICNGITSSMTDEEGIALCETDDPFHSWRWGEQWIPHAAWWFMAFSSWNG
jgi:hypothetical protein